MSDALSVFSEDEVSKACLEYFKGDTLAAQVALKYLLRDKKNRFVEKTPDDMHIRLAKEFYRIEDMFAEDGPMGADAIQYEVILENLKNFSSIVPQGSPMARNWKQLSNS